MERKIKDQEIEIKRLKSELEILNARKLIHTSTEIMNPSEKSLIIQNINWATSLKQPNELKRHLENYHRKIGVAGKKRINHIIDAFEKIEERAFPDFVKHILNSAENNIDMFSQQCFEVSKFKGFRMITNDLYKKLNLSNSQIKSFNVHKEKLKNLNISYKKWIDNLHQMTLKYRGLTDNGFEIFKKLFGILSVEQLSKLTLNFEESNVHEDILEMQSNRSAESVPSFNLRKISEDNSISDNNSIGKGINAIQKRTENIFEIMANDPLLDLLK